MFHAEWRQIISTVLDREDLVAKVIGDKIGLRSYEVFKAAKEKLSLSAYEGVKYMPCEPKSGCRASDQMRVLEEEDYGHDPRR